MRKKALTLTETQRVGLGFLLRQEHDARIETHKFLAKCFKELGLDASKNYTVDDDGRIKESQ